MMHGQEVLADRIEELCKEKNLSYYVLAYRSSVPLTTLMHIMDCSTNNPGVFTISKLCSGLEIQLKDFFDTEEFLELSENSNIKE